jgi:hypothetical protein
LTNIYALNFHVFPCSSLFSFLFPFRRLFLFQRHSLALRHNKFNAQSRHFALSHKAKPFVAIQQYLPVNPGDNTLIHSIGYGADNFDVARMFRAFFGIATRIANQYTSDLLLRFFQPAGCLNLFGTFKRLILCNRLDRAVVSFGCPDKSE